MKKMSMLLLAGFVALTLAGCAATGTGQTMKVKCPACGYQFDMPAERP